MTMEDRIKQARKNAGMSQTELAEAVGVTRSAVALWEAGKNTPRRDVIAKIAEVTGSTIPWIEFGTTATEPLPRSLYVIGEVAGGVWKEGTIEFVPIRMPVSPHPDYPVESQRLYVVHGNSVNRVIPDGEYVHCVCIHESGVKPQHGDLVIVRRMQHDMAEYTAKRLVRSGDHWVLRPESTDPAWQSDIVMNGDDSTSIEITDVVIAKWSPISRMV
jgi:transcriptional regulator with XRE-family HTH domain